MLPFIGVQDNRSGNKSSIKMLPFIARSVILNSSEPTATKLLVLLTNTKAASSVLYVYKSYHVTIYRHLDDNATHKTIIYL